LMIGLRIDVDTLRGTRTGVLNLCRLLDSHSLRGTFFFSVGPDNMGRHLLRLLRPAFLSKMMRTGAPRLYGWDILLRGTLWPGPIIGRRFAGIIRAVADAGHEVGLHAWDHHAWQSHIDRMNGKAVHRTIERGFRLLTEILGTPPICSGVPAWRCNDTALQEKARFPFVYNSDCRGSTTFLPLVRGEVIPQPQIPVTLPTYDEMIGREGITEQSYNDSLLDLLNPAGLNVLAIHAEVEGMACLEMFRRFVDKLRSRRATLVPLGELLTHHPPAVHSAMVRKEIVGREGWVAFQEPNPIV
jgi:undecaprenyl phosphate-alpha-L-ara4FN deformylase